MGVRLGMKFGLFQIGDISGKKGARVTGEDPLW